MGRQEGERNRFWRAENVDSYSSLRRNLGTSHCLGSLVSYFSELLQENRKIPARGICNEEMGRNHQLLDRNETALLHTTVQKASHSVRHGQRAPRRPSSASAQESPPPSPALITSLLKALTLERKGREHREALRMPGIRSAMGGVQHLPQTLHDSRATSFTLMTGLSLREKRPCL